MTGEFSFRLPSAQNLKLNDRQDGDHREQEQRDGCAVTALVERERLLVDVLHDDIGRVERAALRQKIDLIEDLELDDQLKSEDENSHRPDQRPGDRAELPPA